jgi:hypothetical protein
MCTTGHARNPIEKWTRTADLKTVYFGVKDDTIKNSHEFFYSLLDSYPVLS